MKILISDTHFGCRQNSITWLDSQLRFFYEQLIPFIKQQKEPVSLYHLGDLFDIRSSVNLLIASKVHKLFEDLLECCQTVVVIGGNHDYYSPNESEENINSLHIVLNDLTTNPKFQMYDKEFGLSDDYEDLFIPWFRYFDYNSIKGLLHNEPTIKRIFIHNDLTATLEDRYRELFRNYEVYSGHIHTPSHNGNLHTLGSTFALTFADCNADRGFYTMNDDGSDLQFHANTKSIRFFRFYNSEILNKTVELCKEDYVELYVNKDNVLKESYIERIKTITKQVNNIITIPTISQNTTVMNDDSCDFEKYDISDICRQNIPDDLIEKFNKISTVE